VNRFDLLATTPFPSLTPNVHDIVCWDDGFHGLSEFSVKLAYESLQGRMDTVPWHSVVWFKGHIPKHAFCMWLTSRKRLSTEDRMLAWKEEPPDYKCNLGQICADSHTDLFFECHVAKQIWDGVLEAVEWTGFLSSWDAILDAFSNGSLVPKRMLHKLALSASVYEVWRERNRRLFTGERRTSIAIAKYIISTIMLRHAWKSRLKVKTGTNGGM
jgi:hypothetical protein